MATEQGPHTPHNLSDLNPGSCSGPDLTATISPNISSPASIPPTIPPRPTSIDLYKSPEPLSSSMLPYNTNITFKKGKVYPAGRRESAPVLSRSTQIPGEDLQQTKSRPPSNLHFQVQQCSQATYRKPLPTLPSFPASVKTSANMPQGMDGVKVPIDENMAQSSQPSSYIINTNHLHPNRYTPHPNSPQLMPQNLSQDQHRDHDVDSKKHNALAVDIYSLRYHSSMSNDDSSNGFSQSPSTLHPPLDIQGNARTSTQAKVQEQRVHHHEHEQEQKLGHVHGFRNERRQNQDLVKVNEERERSLKAQQQQQEGWADSQIQRGRRLPSERSMLQHHLNNLLHNEAPTLQASNTHATITTPTTITATSSASTTGAQQQCDQRLSKHDTITPSSNSSSMGYNRSFSFSTSSSGRRRASFVAPSLLPRQHHSFNCSSDPTELQPYLPPPLPPAGTNPRQRSRQHTSSSIASTAEAGALNPTFALLNRVEATNPTSANSATSTLHRSSRRHSSSASSLSIKTQHMHSIKRGPSTADAASVSSRGRFLEPDESIRHTARSKPKSNTSSPTRQLSPSSSAYRTPRQSSNHLAASPSSEYTDRQQPHNHMSPHPHLHLYPDNNYQNNQTPRSNSPLPSPSHSPSHAHLQKQQTQAHHHHHRHHHHQQQQQQPQRQQHMELKSSATVCSSKCSSPRPVSPNPSNPKRIHHVDRTAMTLMQQYLACPGDPESEADIAMQILISQAAVDSKGFEVLLPETVEAIKRHHATLNTRISALTARLSLESKICEAARSLLKLHADNKKLARQASDHLEAANRKVDQVSTELWKLTQLASDLQRTLLQHSSGVLALGVVRLEDQGRREREAHVIQLQGTQIRQDLEQQFESMAKLIMDLESDALQAQSLLEDKDHAIERLMNQLDHQRELFIKVDEQQQKTLALSRTQQRNLDAFCDNEQKEEVTEMNNFLGSVQEQLQRILQCYQHQPTHRRRKRGSSGQEEEEGEDKKEKGATALISNNYSANSQGSDSPSPLTRGDSLASDASTAINTSSNSSTEASEVIFGEPKGSTSPTLEPPHFSKEQIRSVLDALERHALESKQKMSTMEGELSLLRRQSAVMSVSRNNSIRIKDLPATPVSVSRGQAEETIRSALEKSLKDALLAKEMAQQELENERQRWQEDQNHRISALEESLGAAEDDRTTTAMTTTTSMYTISTADLSNDMLSRDEMIKALRVQLRDAISEIDTLNQQQQTSLKAMRQLFDLVPDSRRRSHMQLFSSHQQLQQQLAASLGGRSAMPSPSGSSVSLSLSASGAIGFSMEALISRVKDLVVISEQMERDNSELRRQIGNPAERSQQEAKKEEKEKEKETEKKNTHQSHESEERNDQEGPDSQGQSIRILISELERLQASAGMVQLLEKEIDLLKQHTDTLMDENARLAELAAASATNTPAPNRSNIFAGIARKPSQDDTLDQLQEIIRVKDRLLHEREQTIQDHEKALEQAQLELAKVQGYFQEKVDTGGSLRADANTNISGGALKTDSPKLSAFDIDALEGLRDKCAKLEGELGEMRMIVAALESTNGKPRTGSQLLKSLEISSQPQSPAMTPSWLGSTNFCSLSQKLIFDTPASGVNSPPIPSTDIFSNSPNVHSLDDNNSNGNGTARANNSTVTGATAALRKEFRRAMSELREEKEKAVRKEVEERRRLERELRQLRRDLQSNQINTR
ncbi:hypothetical protein BX616_000347 [Lobosporangium transversale]|nr:hypothetical protein BX616_000347 [Lobosporangium transversale]